MSQPPPLALPVHFRGDDLLALAIAAAAILIGAIYGLRRAR